MIAPAGPIESASRLAASGPTATVFTSRLLMTRRRAFTDLPQCVYGEPAPGVVRRQGRTTGAVEGASRAQMLKSEVRRAACPTPTAASFAPSRAA